MGILAMFFHTKSGRNSAAINHAPHIAQHDEVTVELAKAREENCSAAKRLEGLLAGILDSNHKLRQEVHWFNAPSA